MPEPPRGGSQRAHQEDLLQGGAQVDQQGAHGERLPPFGAGKDIQP
jgi:hypothetical protein